jgi:hypothetical protein
VRIARAVRFARSREGIVSFTVVDTRGRRHGFYGDRQFISASVVKAMLMVSYLDIKAIAHEKLDPTERGELRAMVTESDNDAADWVYSRVGDVHLLNLARRMRMHNFSVAGYWASVQVTTNDQARLMKKLDRAVYPPFRSYARSLLSSIDSWERWGIPRVAGRLGWKTFFKGGWRNTDQGRLVHQIARLERGKETVVICVLTDGDPSQEYGEETIAGITKRLLR